MFIVTQIIRMQNRDVYFDTRLHITVYVIKKIKTSRKAQKDLPKYCFNENFLD